MIIVSGLSGAGKTVALHTLEDLGYYCIDNLPINLLPALIEEQKNISQPVAVGIDARSHHTMIEDIPRVIKKLKSSGNKAKILFLTASSETLIKRFSESRRKHILSDANVSDKKLSLADAIELEKEILSPLVADADFLLDTSKTNIYELKERITSWLSVDEKQKTILTINSFGFKNGVPVDADLMFDVRFLPNPHWDSELRAFNGKDKPIQEYLGQFAVCEKFINDTVEYLEKWLPNYFNGHRSYLTIAIGCTGGKHRSVYVSEHIAQRLSLVYENVIIRHRDLPVQ